MNFKLHLPSAKSCRDDWHFRLILNLLRGNLGGTTNVFCLGEMSTKQGRNGEHSYITRNTYKMKEKHRSLSMHLVQGKYCGMTDYFGIILPRQNCREIREIMAKWKRNIVSLPWIYPRSSFGKMLKGLGRDLAQQKWHQSDSTCSKVH